MARSRKIAAVTTGDERIIDALPSFAMLAEDSPYRRKPRSPLRPRPAEFLAGYESRILFYDCFCHADGERVVLVGPPPYNLNWQYHTARFTALPLDYWTSDRTDKSLSVAFTELSDVPKGTREINVRFGMRNYVLPIRPNYAGAFAGHNVLAAMVRDHDLDQIAAWARDHVRHQAVDAIILFDNGSPRYTTAEIEERLSAIAGIKRLAVVPWTFPYGSPDPAVIFGSTYSLFSVNCALTVALHRFSLLARGLLYCPVDEVTHSPQGETVFDSLAKTRRGLLMIPGQSVGGDGTPEQHWALDPQRQWVNAIYTHGYTGRMRGRPPFSTSTANGVFHDRLGLKSPAARAEDQELLGGEPAT